MWNPFKKKGTDGLLDQLEYVSYEEPTENNSSYPEESVALESVEQKGREEEIVDEEPFEEKPIIGLRKIGRCLLLTLVTLVPLWFMSFTVPGDVLVMPKQMLLYGLVVAAFIVWLIIVGKQGGAFLKRSGWEWGILALLGSGLLSALFSMQIHNSFLASNGFSTGAALILFSFLVINFFEKEDLGRLINFFTLGSGLAVLGGMLAVFGVPVFKWLGLSALAGLEKFNTVGSFGALAGLAALSLVLLVARYFTLFTHRTDGQRVSSSEKYWSVVYMICFVVFSLWLLIVNSLMFYTVVVVGMAGVILGLLFISKLNAKRTKLKAIQLVLPMAFLVSSLGLIVATKYFDFYAFQSLQERNAIPVEPALSQKASWDIGKEVINIKPIFGLGDENFISAFDSFKPESINQTAFWNTRFTNATSEFFNLLIERGALGLAAFAFFLFYVFKEAFSKKGGELSEEERLEQVKRAGYLWTFFPAFLAALTLFFLYPFDLTLLMAFWFLVAAMGVAVSAPEKIKVRMEELSASSLAASLVVVLVLVAGVARGYAFIQDYRASIYAAHGMRLANAEKPDSKQAAVLFGKAVDIDGDNIGYVNNFATALLRQIDTELNNKTDEPEVIRVRLEELTQKAVKIANGLLEKKNNSMDSFTAAFIYENLVKIVSGADQAAISAYQQYVALAPKDPNGYLKLGNLFMARADRTSASLIDAKNKKIVVKNEKELTEAVANDYKSAENSFKKAAELRADLANALYNLGLVYERQNRVKEAIKQLELIKANNENNPGLAFELGLLYYRDGAKDKALVEMERAVTLFKDYANARWYLALMLEEKGDVDGAIAQLQEIVRTEVNKENTVVQQKLAALEAGKKEIPPVKVTNRPPL
ncbi:MAG: tetratricopeptide repeat protein [bacterium]|nr:tetratricopeptide repeat protein [bacterium]